MIVTFTANPSIDATVVLDHPLARGELNRATEAFAQAGGKGVNVARVVAGAGLPATPVLAFLDPGFTDLLAAAGIAASGITVDRGVRARTNTTITEPDGTTTKVNEPGPTLSVAQVDAATRHLVETAASTGASWVALSGALPPGAPVDWYARIVRALAPLGCKVAVDTSDAALAAVLDALPEASFDLIKPNSDELAQLAGGDAAAFEADAAAGRLEDIVAAARRLHERGIANVLVTLGGSGAVLVNAEGAWFATPPAVQVLSTVGAGDSSVAGFIIAHANGESPDSCLAHAVAYGSAAAALPGTTLPRPTDTRLQDARVTRLA